jgi:hypothetical protein
MDEYVGRHQEAIAQRGMVRFGCNGHLFLADDRAPAARLNVRLTAAIR